MKTHNFKLGDKVKLVGHNDFELSQCENHPIWGDDCKIKGKVTYIDGYRCEYNICVLWDSGHEYYYNTLELEPFNKWEGIIIEET